MRYLLFWMLVICLPMAIAWAFFDRRMLRWFVLVGMLLPVVVFDATAVNFYSNEWYRGTSRGMEISVIYLAAFVVWCSLVLLKGRFHLAPGWGSWLYLLYFLLSLPSLFHSANVLFSWFEVWKMLMMYLVFLAVYGYLEYTGGDYSVILQGAGILVGLNFLMCIWQHFHGIYQVMGFLPHRNSMAMFMTMMGTLFFAQYFNRRELALWRLPLLCFCLASFAVFRSLSRGAIACYTIGMVVTFLASLWVSLSQRKMQMLGVLAMLGAVGMLYFMPKVFDRFEQDSSGSLEARIRLGLAAMSMIHDEPYTGVGLNNWGIKINPPYPYSEFRYTRPGATEDWMDGIVETIYLLVAAECGIPCLLALLAWFGYYLVVCLRLMRWLRPTEHVFFPVGLLGGLLAVFIQSTLEWVLKQQINFLWLMIFFAVLSYLQRHARELRQQALEQSEARAKAQSEAQAKVQSEAQEEN